MRSLQMLFFSRETRLLVVRFFVKPQLVTGKPHEAFGMSDIGSCEESTLPRKKNQCIWTHVAMLLFSIETPSGHLPHIAKATDDSRVNCLRFAKRRSVSMGPSTGCITVTATCHFAIQSRNRHWIHQIEVAESIGFLRAGKNVKKRTQKKVELGDEPKPKRML